MATKPEQDGAHRPFESGKQPKGGRPKGAKNKSTLFREQIEHFRAKAARGEKLISPLELFNMVLNDETMKLTMRLRAAESAAPYQHSKLPMRMPMEDPNDTFAKVRAALRQMGAVSNGVPTATVTVPPDVVPPPKEEPK